MGAPDLLQYLRAAGLVLNLTTNGGIKVAPASQLSDDDRRAIRHHRAELLTLLSEPVELAPDGKTKVESERFAWRLERLTRWGWPPSEALVLAERLTKRDRTDDDRVSCADCRHFRPGSCGNNSRAGLPTADLGRDLAGTLQRCPGFAFAG